MQVASSSLWILLVTEILSGLLGAHGAIREYTFEVNYFKANLDNTKKAWIQGINGSIPGPEIRVKRGDRLRLTLINKCQTETLSLHFHGFEMRHAQEYDGAMPITQCGLQPGNTMVYEFDIDEPPGTYIYHEHAHLTHVAGIGFFGAIIVEEAANDHSLWAGEYCGDACDATLAIFDYWTHSPHYEERVKIGRRARPPMVSDQSNGVGLLAFNNLLINAKGAFNVFGDSQRPGPNYVTAKTKVSDLHEITPQQGQIWRLRIINAGSLYAFRFRIDGHRLKVIQTDAADVEPFLCDAITLSSGERFDVLVEFNKDPGSYWMRAETLEKGWGIRHGQLGIVRYNNTPQGVLPDKGYDMKHTIEEDPSLVTLNCIDQALLSLTCLPITALRRHKSPHSTHVPVGHIDEETHDFEVSLRAFYGLINTHMTRVLDLSNGGNQYGKNQFDGEFTEFAFPAVPYSYVNGKSIAEHENTVKMEVGYNETVRVVIQSQDRAAHPWHLHGHKFAVLAQGFPDYKKDCDILYCRSERNHWITRDGAIQANGKFASFGRLFSAEDSHSLRYPTLLDPQEAPLKDTVHLPAGGWAVIQFKADNPGWWFFHCHMAIHAHGGMALVLIEGLDHLPPRLVNSTYLDEKGFPSCQKELKAFQAKGPGKSCDCYQNAEMKMDNFPRDYYHCTNHYLCGQLLLNPLEPSTPAQLEGSQRNRVDGWPWRIAMFYGWVFIIICYFLVKHFFAKGFKRRHEHAVKHTKPKFEKGDHQLNSSIKGINSFKDNAAAFVNFAEKHHMKALVGKHQEKINREVYHLPIEFVACKGASPTTPAAAGKIPSGSVMCLIGPHHETSGWVDFFAARARPNKKPVRGNLSLGGLHVADWERQEIRQSFAFVGQPLEALRPNIAVLEALDLYLHLGSSDSVHPRFEDKLRYRHDLITMLRLRDHLAQPMGELRPDAFIRARIAQELILPRSVLVLEDPLGRLDARHAKKVMKMLAEVAEHLGVTIIFSAEHILGDVGKYVTHGLLVTKDVPVFGTPGELEAFIAMLGRTRRGCPSQPEGMELFEHISQLFAKNHFENLLVDDQKRGTSPSGRVSEASSSPARSSRGSKGSSPSSGEESLAGFEKTCSFSDYAFKFVPHDAKKAFGTEPIHYTSNHTIMQKLILRTRRYESRNDGDRPRRRRKNLCSQIMTLTYFQGLKGLKEFITVYAFLEKFSLGMVAGVVWWRKGSDDTQTSLGEIFGLLFFSTGFNTVPPIFQALHEVPTIVRLARQEFSGGLYNLYALAIAMLISTFFTMAAVWPPFWQITAYSCAQVGSDPGTMITMHLVLALNVLACHTMGLVIALIIPPPQTNVVLGNLVGQLFMLTNGFYTKLPAAFMWVTVFSIPRYTLKALLKLEFYWKDAFKANPMVGFPAFGFPTLYLPAQLTGVFLTMEDREMDVMKTGEQLSALPEIMYLLLFIVLFHVFFITLLFCQVHSGEVTRMKYKDSKFNVLDTSDWVGKKKFKSGAEDLQSEDIGTTIGDIDGQDTYLPRDDQDEDDLPRAEVEVTIQEALGSEKD